jgi:aconitase A
VKNDYPVQLVALIGGCTNSSYEDIDRSAHLPNKHFQKLVKMQFTITWF